jgi:hypothetical protein
MAVDPRPPRQRGQRVLPMPKPAPYPPIPGQPYDPWRALGGQAPRELLADRRLASSAKLIYQVLIRYTDRSGRCWPSIAQLAADLAMAQRTAKWCLSRLRRFGYVSVERLGRWRTRNTYALIWQPAWGTSSGAYQGAWAPRNAGKPEERRGGEAHGAMDGPISAPPYGATGCPIAPGHMGQWTAPLMGQWIAPGTIPVEPEQGASSSSHLPGLAIQSREASEKRDDDDRPIRSDWNELIDLIHQSTGQPPDRKLMLKIFEHCQLAGVTLRQYLDDIKPRLCRLRSRPGPGFFYRHAEQFRQSRPAPKARPMAQASGPCTCRFGRLETGEYCDRCQLGRDLRRIEARKESAQ